MPDTITPRIKQPQNMYNTNPYVIIDNPPEVFSLVNYLPTPYDFKFFDPQSREQICAECETEFKRDLCDLTANKGNFVFCSSNCYGKFKKVSGIISSMSEGRRLFSYKFQNKHELKFYMKHLENNDISILID